MREPRPGDDIYTCSVVATRADTAVKWYFQFTLMTSTITTPRKLRFWWMRSLTETAQVACGSQRNGFIYLLDRVTGEFLAATRFCGEIELGQRHRQKGFGQSSTKTTPGPHRKAPKSAPGFWRYKLVFALVLSRDSDSVFMSQEECTPFSSPARRLSKKAKHTTDGSRTHQGTRPKNSLGL